MTDQISDKVKLLRFADSIGKVSMPDLDSEKAQDILKRAGEDIVKLQAHIMDEANELGD
jgi:hypothetical protein